MKLDNDSMKPIYVQVAQWLETEILSDIFGVDQKIYSQYQLADMFNINPATAAKGLNILVDKNILYKKRGLGMFVSKDSKKIILKKRINNNLKKMIENIVKEAECLNISKKELLDLIISEINQKKE